jgi:hypothetical protein
MHFKLFLISIHLLSRGIATGYELDDRMIGVRFPAVAENFSLRHYVQTGSGVHSTSYPWG